MNTVTCMSVCDSIDGVWINGFIDHLYTHSELPVNTALSLISTLHKSLHAKSTPAWSVFTSHSLVTASNSEDSSAPCAQVLSSQPPVQNSKSKLLYDWRFTANQFLLATTPRWPRPEVPPPQLNPWGNSPHVTSSLTRRWVCLLWTCLAFRQVYISHI
jgi:hypothetical protein